MREYAAPPALPNDEHRPSDVDTGLLQYLNMVQRNWNRGTPLKGDEKFTLWDEPAASVEAERRLFLVQDDQSRWFISGQGWEWAASMRARFPGLCETFPDLKLREE